MSLNNTHRGLTMIVKVEVEFLIHGVKISPTTMQTEFMLTADEFNLLRKQTTKLIT